MRMKVSSPGTADSPADRFRGCGFVLMRFTCVPTSNARSTRKRINKAYFSPLRYRLIDEVKDVTPLPGRIRNSLERLLWFTHEYLFISQSLRPERGSSPNLYFSAQRENSRRKMNCHIITATTRRRRQV